MGGTRQKATPKKRQDARKKGQVAKSAELSGAVVLFSALLSLTMFGSFMKERFMSLYMDVFQNRMMMEVTAENVSKMFNEYGLQILILLAPLLGITFLLALVVNFAQVGFMASGEGITPKFSKINPIKGFKNIFSMRSFVEFLKSVFKLVLIAYLVYSTLWGEKESFAALSHVNAEGVYRFTAKMTMNLGIKIAAVLFIMAVLDYMYQKYEHEKV